MKIFYLFFINEEVLDFDLRVGFYLLLIIYYLLLKPEGLAQGFLNTYLRKNVF